MSLQKSTPYNTSYKDLFANGVGKMHFCTDSVTGEYYCNLLHEEIRITCELLLLPEKVWFVQDGALAQRVQRKLS
uniref:AlNc14C382G11235 protein n=1 Tax=Albugo laibachii Nc14 TaxID=890382 RepID=F0WYH4_9STRA|nr:AlNc14C382G11235 [Albugo laibachii Nc14]|eukprot:CCA26529.1 AlNc14C382G11235 [Albugo laibachii Nc14]